MMLYANLFSSGFTALGLLLDLEIVSVARFVDRNPQVATLLTYLTTYSLTIPHHRTSYRE